MKSSGNASVSMLIFLALAIIVFILMVLRPSVEKTAMNLGVPIMSENAASDVATNSNSAEESAQKESSISTDLNAEADESDETDSTSTETSAQKESPTSTDLNGEAEESESSEETTTEPTTTN